MRYQLVQWSYTTLALLRHGIVTSWQVLTWPIRATWQWFAFGWEHRRTRDLIRGLPGLVGLIAVAVLSAAVRVDANALPYSYWLSASESIASEDFESAEIFLQRVLELSGTSDPKAEFALGEVFERTGRLERAQWLFDKLAPEGRPGFPAAHRKRAVALASVTTSNSSSEEIQRLRRHLSLADEQESPMMARAWAAYYLALNQAQQAIERLEKAVSEYPELRVQLGDLYLQLKQNDRAYGSFSSASDFFRKRLEIDPGNEGVRITFAVTLLRLGKLDECEGVLTVGLKLDPKGPYKQLLASLYTNRHDLLARRKDITLSDLLGQLHSALSFDPTYAPAYERLVGYGEAKAKGEVTLREILNEVIAEGKEPGLAHFAMSILTWKEKDFVATKWHLERAHSLLPAMPFVSNNLAWILATEEPVDLDRALSLIEPAVKAFPDEPRLLDTRATILVKQEKWDAALDDLERALQYQKNAQAIAELHEKLALVCDKLNKPELAEMHRRLLQGTLRPTAPPISRPASPAKNAESNK